MGSGLAIHSNLYIHNYRLSTKLAYASNTEHESYIKQKALQHGIANLYSYCTNKNRSKKSETYHTDRPELKILCLHQTIANYIYRSPDIMYILLGGSSVNMLYMANVQSENFHNLHDCSLNQKTFPMNHCLVDQKCKSTSMLQ